jgi:hypothetical protein
VTGLSGIWRLIATLTLLVAVAALPGCMLVPHHGLAGGPRTEQAAQPHAEHGAETTEPTTAEVGTADKTQHGHEGMSMMHGSGRWGWFVGGAMVVMMVLVVL